MPGAYGYRPQPGARPAVADYRDSLVGPHLGVPAFTLVTGVVGIGTVDQGRTGMCVDFSCGLALDIEQRQARAPHPVRLSPPWLYGKNHLGDTQEGTDPVQALALLQRVGVCPWDLDPFTAADVSMTAAQAVATLKPDMDVAAGRRKLAGYASVPVDLDHIRAVLHQGHPVLLDATVFPAFESPQRMALHRPPRPLAELLGQDQAISGVAPGSWLGQQALGGHQFVAVGTLPRAYLPEPLSEGCEDYLLCITSWGDWVADGGPEAVFALPAPYLAQTVEAWVLTGIQAA